MTHYSRVARSSGPSFPSITNEFAPFFRLFDEVNSMASRPVRSFQPRFDVREEKDAFHLQGELPGIEQRDIQIEFVDHNTLTVHGRTVKESTHGTPPAIEGAQDKKSIESANGSKSSYHKPSVESEEADGAATTSSEVAHTSNGGEAGKKEESGTKYWVSERSVGEFHRSFTFPGQVNQDGVTASLKNGILSVVVPKAVQKQPRRITVE